MQLNKRIKAVIKCHANHSFFKLNAKTADCYAFSLIKNKNKLDFDGGWDWSTDLVDKNAEYIYMLDTDIFRKVIKNEITGDITYETIT